MTDDSVLGGVASSRRRKAVADFNSAIGKKEKQPAPHANEPNHVTARRARAEKRVNETKVNASEATRDDLLANHAHKRENSDELRKI